MKFSFLLLLVFSLSCQAYETKHYDIHRKKGLKRTEMSRKFLREAKKVSHFKRAALVPGMADISARVSLPDNQLSCGCCWAFSLTKALRSAWMIAGADPGVLEYNYLINNCGPAVQEDGCNGGDFNAAQNFENGFGPGLNSADPFTGVDGGKCPGLPVAATAITYQMLGAESGPTFKDLATAVGVDNQMLSIDVAAGSGDWENYSSGIYDGCTGTANDIDHMIDLVGYNCQTSIDSAGNCAFDSNGEPINGDGYLIVENNWGEDWGIKAANGHGGYMMTRYMVGGKRCNAIATDALQFTVAPPSPPIPPVPPAPPSPAPAPAPMPNVPLWLWIVGGIVVALIVGDLVVKLIVKKSPTP